MTEPSITTTARNIAIAAKLPFIKMTCTAHQITVKAIEKIIKADIQRVCSFAKDHEKDFLNLLKSNSDIENKKLQAAMMHDFEESERRIKTLDKIIQSLYEDKVEGRITEERFNKLANTYETEQDELVKQTVLLRQ